MRRSADDSPATQKSRGAIYNEPEALRLADICAIDSAETYADEELMPSKGIGCYIASRILRAVAKPISKGVELNKRSQPLEPTRGPPPSS